jgi:hypothetical protein
MTTSNDVKASLAAIDQRRFKVWFNPERLALQDSMKACIHRDYPVYFLIHNRQQEVSRANHLDGHLDCAAVLTTCNWLLEYATQNIANEFLLKAIEDFIVHLSKHNCTPIWGQMKAEAEYLLTEAQPIVEQMLELKRWAA